MAERYTWHNPFAGSTAIGDLTVSLARNPSTLSSQWTAWMRESTIPWRLPSVRIDAYGNLENNKATMSQPAAAQLRRRSGNIVRHSDTHYDLYTRRHVMDPASFQERVRDHFLVLKGPSSQRLMTSMS